MCRGLSEVTKPYIQTWGAIKTVRGVGKGPRKEGPVKVWGLVSGNCSGVSVSDMQLLVDGHGFVHCFARAGPSHIIPKLSQTILKTTDRQESLTPPTHPTAPNRSVDPKSNMPSRFPQVTPGHPNTALLLLFAAVFLAVQETANDLSRVQSLVLGPCKLCKLPTKRNETHRLWCW